MDEVAVIGIKIKGDFETNFPDWKKYKISAMYLKIFDAEKVNIHDALEDAKALYEIMEEVIKDDRDSNLQTILKFKILSNNEFLSVLYEIEICL